MPHRSACRNCVSQTVNPGRTRGLTIPRNIHPRHADEHPTDHKGKQGVEEHANFRGWEPRAGRPLRRLAVCVRVDGNFQHPRSVLHTPSPIGAFLQVGVVRRAGLLFGTGRIVSVSGWRSFKARKHMAQGCVVCSTAIFPPFPLSFNIWVGWLFMQRRTARRAYTDLRWSDKKKERERKGSSQVLEQGAGGERKQKGPQLSTGQRRWRPSRLIAKCKVNTGWLNDQASRRRWSTLKGTLVRARAEPV